MQNQDHKEQKLQHDRAVALIIRDNQILLIHRQTLDRDYYVLPGGSVEAGETPEIACIREAKEETGLSVTIIDYLGAFTNNQRLEHYFLVAAEHGEPVLGGPEYERQGEHNRYSLLWARCEQIGALKIQPRLARQIILAQL